MLPLILHLDAIVNNYATKESGLDVTPLAGQRILDANSNPFQKLERSDNWRLKLLATYMDGGQREDSKIQLDLIDSDL